MWFDFLALVERPQKSASGSRRKMVCIGRGGGRVKHRRVGRWLVGTSGVRGVVGRCGVGRETVVGVASQCGKAWLIAVWSAWAVVSPCVGVLGGALEPKAHIMACDGNAVDWRP